MDSGLSKDELIARLRRDAQPSARADQIAAYLESVSQQPLSPDALARLAEARRAHEAVNQALQDFNAAKALLADLLEAGDG
jgi:hypothetical protein